MTTQRKNTELVNLLSTNFVGRWDSVSAWSRSVSIIMGLPGLVAFVPCNMGGVTPATTPYLRATELVNRLDLTTRTGFGSPKFSNENYLSYLRFRNLNSDLIKVDDNEIHRITGTATTYFGKPGLTIGCWMRPLTVPSGNPASRIFWGRWSSTNNRAYGLFQGATTDVKIGMVVNDQNNAVSAVRSTTDAEANKWFFVVGLWEPSVTKSIIVNDLLTDFATGGTGNIPSQLSNNNQGIAMGAASDGNADSRFDGDVCLAFICAVPLPIPVISAIFYQTAPMFGYNSSDFKSLI